MEELLLIGSGGHAKSVIDSIESQRIYKIAGFLDILERQGTIYKNYKVIGSDIDAEKFFKDGIKNAFICIGYLGKGNIRNKLYDRLKSIGFRLPAIIDKTAVLAEDISIGEGTFIGKRTIINSDVHVGNMCIINTGVIIEHDCIIQDFTHISVAAVICGKVNIGKGSFIGANSTIIQECNIGEHCIIGAGTTVVRRVEDRRIMIGKNCKLRGGGLED